MHALPDLKLLVGFLAVVEHGSVTSAAGSLNLSQPALSRQVSELERRLSITLFDRSPTSLRLTSAAHQFVPLARDLVERAETLRLTAHRISTGQATQFRVACPEATVRGVVAPFVAATSAPIVDTTLAIASQVYPHVLSRGADLAINTLLPPLGLESEHIGSAGLWVHFPSDHRFKDQESVSVEDLTDDPIIVLATGTGLRRIIDEALWPVRDRVTIAVEPISSDLAIALVAAGRGVALDISPLPFGLLRRPLIGVDGTRVTMPLYAAWEAEHFATGEIRSLVASLTTWMVGHEGI